MFKNISFKNIMNYIGIDPSLVSTGLTINGKMFNFCRESAATLSKGGLSKWFSLSEQYLNLRFIELNEYKDYSTGEIQKIKDYDKITDSIIKTILETIDKEKHTKIAIEGYNFGATVGDLVDLVAFSTILRKKLLLITEDITIVSPSTLKLESCKLTYPPIIKGTRVKKYEYRNNDGISGGIFTKKEIFMSICDNADWDDDWAKHCKSIKEDLLDKKTIPKPYEDVNDSYILYRYIKQKSDH